MQLSRPLNILFISPEYPLPKPSGGIASYVRDIASELGQRGHSIKIICYDNQHQFDSPFSILMDDSVEIHYVSPSYAKLIPKALESKSIRRAFRWLFPDLAVLIPPLITFIYFRRLSRVWRPDIIESFDWEANGLFVNLFAKKIPKILRGAGHAKIIITSNNIGWNRRFEAQHRIERWAARASDLLMPCSKSLGHHEISDFDVSPEKVIPVPNCLNYEFFDPGSSVAKVHTDEIIILFVGRLEYRKGVDLLIEAGHRLYPNYKNVKYYFIGKDRIDMPKYLGERSFDPGYLKLLNFIEEISRYEIRRYLRKCHFAVFPSRYEPFGIVALEAMACGIPLIVGGGSGLEEIVENRVSGIVLERNDVESLSLAIEEMISYPEERRKEMGKKGKERVESQYSVQVVADRKEKIYSWLIARSRKKDLSPNPRC